jgi:hypothetical protein
MFDHLELAADRLHNSVNEPEFRWSRPSGLADDLDQLREIVALS